MGGWMTYQRMRTRNSLMFQGTMSLRKPPEDPDPYFRGSKITTSVSVSTLIGDLNRMERDYTNPVYPNRPLATRPDLSDPANEVAVATGIPAETVRKVMLYVFFGQP